MALNMHLIRSTLYAQQLLPLKIVHNVLTSYGENTSCIIEVIASHLALHCILKTQVLSSGSHPIMV